jgi:hypothetical protein
LTKNCKQVSNGKFTTDGGNDDRIPVCGLNGAFFWVADMDIDCDGAGAGQCTEDGATQSQTSFTTSKGKFYDANVVPYYVIPDAGCGNGGCQTRFSYTKNNIQPGAVAAIIFNNKLIYAVFADEGPSKFIGEASVAAAKLLGINPSPVDGGTDGPVTYIVFPGKEAVPNPPEDHNAATKLGEALARRLIDNNK